jgi:hypothetical protein
MDRLRAVKLWVECQVLRQNLRTVFGVVVISGANRAGHDPFTLRRRGLKAGNEPVDASEVTAL